MKQIPATIHLTYARGTMTDLRRRCLESVQDFHPGWQIQLYDDEQCRDMIASGLPELLPVYDAYPYGIQRADFFRAAVVYLQGGFYLDMDMHCYQSLDNLRTHDLVLAVEKVLSQKAGTTPEHKHAQRIANYAFGGAAGHPFFLDLLDAAVRNSGRPVRNTHDVLESTGPGLLTNVYHARKFLYRDTAVLENKHHHCRQCRSDIPSCHFGDYAAHLHTGAWRRQFSQ